LFVTANYCCCRSRLYCNTNLHGPGCLCSDGWTW